VGNFIIDIEVVSKADLISIRKLLPSEEYRLFKNRKSARICRRKRKQERSSVSLNLHELFNTNTDLWQEIEKTQFELKQS
jgi:hypothetical protein